MKQIPFYIVDVFTDQAFSGNQLAVFILDDNLEVSIRQQLAKELHFSETIFLQLTENHIIDAWIHTPEEEIPFGGHPLIGAAFIWHSRYGSTLNKVVFRTKSGLVPVLIDNQTSIYWMTQQTPQFSQVIPPYEAAKVLGLKEVDFHPFWPVQEISTGLPVVVAPVKSVEVLKRTKLNHTAYEALISRIEAKGICVFAMEGDRSDLSVRDFAPYYGIPEDVATGSSNGAILAFIMKHEAVSRLSLVSEQGVFMNRPSTLHLKGEKKVNSFDIHVGGQAVLLASGTWNA